MDNKLTGLLGICRRAGHLIIGFDAVKDLIRARKAKVILTAADLSEKTAKELRFQMSERAVPLYALSADKTALAAALGLQKPVGVVATDDSGFAAAIKKYFPAETKEDDAQ